jgi:putative two-component system response regulator
MNFAPPPADRADIVIVDDQPENLEILVALLSPEYRVHPFNDGKAMLRYVAAGRPVDLFLLDVMMPPPDGYELCSRLRSSIDIDDVPVIFLTALNSLADEEHGLDLGAADYITKPFSPPIVLARVRHHVRLARALRIIAGQNSFLDQRVAERTAELADANNELRQTIHQLSMTKDATIVALSSLAETRDNETGQHIRRTQNYVRELALRLRETPEFSAALDDAVVETLYKSASLHDIGKVAIPDRILRKPGRLSAEEFEIMKTHCDHGRSAIETAEAALLDESSFLRLARDIAWSHHERWDGMGYPRGLAGSDIPLAARLMAVADVYDALICRRVYKAPMSHETAVGLIRDGRGTQFDPQVTDAFLAIEGRFRAIAERFADA